MAALCVTCGESFEGKSQCKQFPMCDPCYNQAFELDMSGRLRNLAFKAPDYIIDNIYLGGESATLDAAWLATHSVDRILTVACHMDHLVHHPGIDYLRIDVDDDPSEDLRQHWDAAFEFIGRRTNTNVLIHCVSGISRSGATVVAYVMHSRRLRFEASLELVQARRPEISPNSGFQAQLRSFERELRVEPLFSPNDSTTQS